MKAFVERTWTCELLTKLGGKLCSAKWNLVATGRELESLQVQNTCVSRNLLKVVSQFLTISFPENKSFLERILTLEEW